MWEELKNIKSGSEVIWKSFWGVVILGLSLVLRGVFRR